MSKEKCSVKTPEGKINDKYKFLKHLASEHSKYLYKEF